MLEITVYSSVMIAAVIAMKALWRGRISSKILNFLWIIVLLRLIIPVTLESPIHLDSLLPKKPTEEVQTTPQIAQNNADLAEPYTAGNEFDGEFTAPNTDYDGFDATELPSADYSPEKITLLKRIRIFITGISIWVYIAAAWAAGALVFLLKALSEYIGFYRRVRCCPAAKSGALPVLVNECRKTLNVKKEVQIASCRYVSTPVTFGIGWPVILLPVNFADKIDYDKLKMIVMHELCHIKNRDILKNSLWLWAKTVHWFNPLVWLAYRHHLNDIELVCDEMVIAHIGHDKCFEYSQSLLDVIKLSRKRAKANAGIAFCEEKTKIRKRVENMMHLNKKSKSAAFMSLVMAAVLIVGCFTTACQPAPDETIAYAEQDTAENASAAESESPETQTRTPEPEQTPEEDFEPAYTAPETVQKDIFSGDGTINININADVHVPKTQTFPIYSVESVKLTQENLDNFLDEFFPERTAVATSEITQLPTKENYQKLIDEREEWMATKEEHPNERGPSNHELWQQEIDFYKEQIKDAPESNLEVPQYVITQFSTIPLMDVFWDAELTAKELEQQLEDSKARAAANNTELIEYDILTDDAQTYSIYALHSDDPNVNIFWINNGKYYVPYSIENYGDIAGLETSYDEAYSIAERAVQALGIDYMSMDFASIGQYTRGKDPQAGVSYHFVFTRNVDGANVTYTQNIVNNPETDYRSWQYNYFEIWIDDSGISTIHWYSSSSEIKNQIAQDSKLMPFEEVMAKAEESFEEGAFTRSRNSHEADQMLAENRATIYENNIIIDDIKLGYMRATTGPEDYNYTLIPVWDFIGRESIRLDIKHKTNGQVHEAESDMPEYGDCHSFLTINAIDGTVINRRKGY